MMSNSGASTMPIPAPPSSSGNTRSQVVGPLPAECTTHSIESTPASISTTPACSVRRPNFGASTAAPLPAPIAVPSDHAIRLAPEWTAE